MAEYVVDELALIADLFSDVPAECSEIFRLVRLQTIDLLTIDEENFERRLSIIPHSLNAAQLWESVSNWRVRNNLVGVCIVNQDNIAVQQTTVAEISQVTKPEPEPLDWHDLSSDPASCKPGPSGVTSGKEIQEAAFQKQEDITTIPGTAEWPVGDEDTVAENPSDQEPTDPATAEIVQIKEPELLIEPTSWYDPFSDPMNCKPGPSRVSSRKQLQELEIGSLVWPNPTVSKNRSSVAKQEDITPAPGTYAWPVDEDAVTENPAEQEPTDQENQPLDKVCWVRGWIKNLKPLMHSEPKTIITTDK
ncbi:uncharacterized protein LOC134286396 [Aedes albopictus]|uniref:Uncharacterized protein n=1 Tax=Aedes albopictus TaxID=7160 RepID=A0ABM1YJE6_AEDAL